MKNLSLVLAIILSILCFTVFLSSCGECDHSYGEWTITKEANCSEAGEKQRVCTECGEIEKQVIDKLEEGGHSFGGWSISLLPTCIAKGEEKRVCSLCQGEEKRELDILKEAHSFGDWATKEEPTCSQEGEKERVCTLCEKAETAIIPILEEGGHSFGEWDITIEPTCSQEGQRVRYCTRCEEANFEVLSIIDDQGHSYGEWYTVTEPTCSQDGEKHRDCIYCDDVDTDVIPKMEAGGHSFGDWTVSIEPTCSTKGERKRQCILCEKYEVEEIDPLDEGGHSFGDWYNTNDPTCDSEGEKRRDCSLCDAYETEVLNKLPIAYTITLNVDGSTSVLNIPENGLYILEAPYKLGYDFVGWISDENQFPSSGIVTESKEVTAVFEVSPTRAFSELKTRVEGKVDKILIDADIVLTDTIYVTGNTTIYSTGSYKLTRSADFFGDLFVLGEDETGRNIILDGGSLATLTFKTEGTGTLTLDGNKDALTGTVNGSALFMLNGSTFNMYDGVTITNHYKLGNEKVYDERYALGENELIGGSVAIIDDGTFNMYGGEISNNSVNLKYCSATPEEERVEGYRISSYGGAIYSIGAINIYGGVIDSNEASYGGFAFSSRTFNATAGEIKNNVATSYGGVIFSSNNGAAINYLGSDVEGTNKEEITLKFSGNEAKGGGAIYLQYSNSMVIYGNTRFEGNKAVGKTGGAIYTGGELIINYAEFVDNIAADRGGALYGAYSEAEKAVRVIDIKNAIFEGNSAARGGAIGASATSEATGSGAVIELGDVTFKNNFTFKTEASTPTFIDNVDREGVVKNYNGNGGVAHLTAKCEIHLYGTVLFDSNEAPSKGGAIYLTNSSKLKTVEGAAVSFVTNKAGTYGGAVYAVNSSSADLSAASFAQNQADRGGVIALLEGASATLSGIIADGNAATSTGGFAYAELSSLELSSVGGLTNEIKNTSSQKSSAGVFYLEGSTLTIKGEKDNNVLINNNTANIYGGVICAYVGEYTEEITNTETGEVTEETVLVRSTVNISYATLDSNKANAKSQYGGGAIYASKTDLIIDNTIFNANEAVYGGAISLYSGSILNATDVVFTNNVAKANGGVMYTSKSTATFNGVTINGNKATGYTLIEDVLDETTGEPTGETTETVFNGQGGAFFINSNSTITVSGLNADGNKAFNGGFMLVAYSVVEISGNINNNTADELGGALLIKSNSDVTLTDIKADKNSAYNGGFIYAEDSALKINGEKNEIKNSTASSTESQLGAGSVYLYDTSATLSNVSFTANTGANGGAVGVKGCGLVEFIGCTFDSNEATSTGGAIYINTSEVYFENCNLTGNIADGNGGAFYSTTSTITIKDTSFTGNTSSLYGGVVYMTKTTYTSDGGSYSGNTGEYGGAIAVNTNSTCTVKNANMAENKATNGAAIYIKSGSLTVDGVDFESNNATLNGGAIYAIADSNVTVTLVVDDSTFTQNTAGLGGAIYLKGTPAVEVTDEETGETTVTEQQGVVTLTSNKSLTFSGNTATDDAETSTENDGHGGAIYASCATINLNAGVIANGNQANMGGAIYLIESTEANINDITLNGNESTSGGAGIYLAGSNLILNGISASSNVSGGTGGAIYAGAGSLTINAGTLVTQNLFDKNSAAKGGAIFIYNTSTAFKANEIVATNNEATTNYGGALYIRGTSVTCDIGTLTLTNNKAASNGGGAYLYAFKGGKIGTIVANGNTTETSGGALYIAGNIELEIESISGSGNTATKTGGYMIITGTTSNVVINSANIGENTDENGNAIHIQYSGIIKVYEDKFVYPEGKINDVSKLTYITEEGQ